MKDWRGWESVFKEGRLPAGEILDLTEEHFTYRAIPVVHLWAPFDEFSPAVYRDGFKRVRDGWVATYQPLKETMPPLSG